MQCNAPRLRVRRRRQEVNRGKRSEVIRRCTRRHCAETSERVSPRLCVRERERERERETLLVNLSLSFHDDARLIEQRCALHLRQRLDEQPTRVGQ